MADFASAKSAWIKSVGDPVTIIRSGGNISTFGRYAKGRQLLSPYEINFLRFMNFPVDSGINRGDLIQEETLGYQALVAATQGHPQFAEDTAIYTELYLINYASIEVQRDTPPQYDTYGNPIAGTGGWSTVATLPMSIEHVNGNVPYKDGLLLSDTLYRLYAQASADILLKPTPDRIIIDGNPLMVSDINLTVAPGLQIVQVKTDTRS